MSASPARADDEINGSTLRSRRRRERLRASGLKTAVYALDRQVADGIDVAAARLGVDPSIYLTRLVLPDLMHMGIVRNVGTAPETAPAEKAPAEKALA